MGGGWGDGGSSSTSACRGSLGIVHSQPGAAAARWARAPAFPRLWPCCSLESWYFCLELLGSRHIYRCFKQPFHVITVCDLFGKYWVWVVVCVISGSLKSPLHSYTDARNLYTGHARFQEYGRTIVSQTTRDGYVCTKLMPTYTTQCFLH